MELVIEPVAEMIVELIVGHAATPGDIMESEERHCWRR